MKQLVFNDRIDFIVGRLEGLAGTVRHEITDDMRAELRAIAKALNDIRHDPPKDPSNGG